MVKNMTEGSPLKHILSFTMPLLFGNLFQQVYNIADTAIVGRFLGTDELAAVGSTGSLMFLILGFVMGIATGFGILVSRYFGANDVKNLRSAVANIIYLSVAVSVVLTLFASTFTQELLRLMGTPADIEKYAYDYIHVIFTFGIFSSMFYNTMASLLRAIGDSKTPLYFLIVASMCNVVLDFFFILVCGMGVEGAAVATVISQFVSGVLCFIYTVKKFPILHVKKEDMPYSAKMSGRLFAQGIPMALQFSLTAIGSVILQFAVNSLGSGIVAAVTAANKVQSFVVQPMESIGITMATYAGQNLGARNIGRIKKGLFTGIAVELCYVIFAFPLIFFAGQFALQLFVDPAKTQIFSDAVRFMRICACFYPFLSVIFVMRNSAQGMGYSGAAMFSGAFELVARTLVALIFVKMLGYTAVCYAGPAAWVAADILLIPLSVFAITRTEKRIKRDTQIHRKDEENA